MKSANAHSTEGIEVYSVDYTIPNETKRTIINALAAIGKNPDILSCDIIGNSVWATVKMFDSTIDDPDRKEIPRGDTFEFKSDVQYIEVRKSGAVCFKAKSKWGEGYLTFDME